LNLGANKRDVCYEFDDVMNIYLHENLDNINVVTAAGQLWNNFKISMSDSVF